MGQLDQFTNRAHARRVEPQAAFAGSVDGGPYDALTRALILEFVTRPVIRRAYLAETVSGDARGVALCLVVEGSSDNSIVTRAGDIFGRTFPKDAVLDVEFLSPERERKLEAVCRPFYSRP